MRSYHNIILLQEQFWTDCRSLVGYLSFSTNGKYETAILRSPALLFHYRPIIVALAAVPPVFSATPWRGTAAICSPFAKNLGMPRRGCARRNLSTCLAGPFRPMTGMCRCLDFISSARKYRRAARREICSESTVVDIPLRF